MSYFTRPTLRATTERTDPHRQPRRHGHSPQAQGNAAHHGLAATSQLRAVSSCLNRSERSPIARLKVSPARPLLEVVVP